MHVDKSQASTLRTSSSGILSMLSSKHLTVRQWNAETHGGSISHEVGVWGIDLLLDRCHDVWPPRLATLLRLLCSIHVNPNLVGYLQKSKTETLKYWQLTPNYSKVKLESTSGKAWGLLKIDEIHTSGPKYHDTSGQQCFLGQPLSTKSPGLLPSSSNAMATILANHRRNLSMS